MLCNDTLNNAMKDLGWVAVPQSRKSFEFFTAEVAKNINSYYLKGPQKAIFTYNRPLPLQKS